MRKAIAFLLAAAVLTAGTILLHAKIWKIEEDVVITEEILSGDIRWMEGKTAELRYQTGNQLQWDLSYAFGKTPSCTSSFELLTKSASIRNSITNEFSIEPHYGYIYTGTVELDPAYPLYGMITKLLDETPVGETRSTQFPTIDYFENYPYRLYLSYVSPSQMCNCSYDFSPTVSQADQCFFQDFSEKFRFPVSETDSTFLSVQKNSQGKLEGFDFRHQENLSYGFYTAFTDDGLYLLPYYETIDGKPLRGEFPEGRGLYYLPWKIEENVTFETELEGQPVSGHGVLPDMDHLQNLFSIDDDIPVRYFDVSEDQHTSRILTEESDGIYLNVLGIPDGTLHNRVRLMDNGADPAISVPTAAVQNGFMVVSAAGKMALVNLDKDCQVEFCVDSDGAEQHLYGLQESNSMVLRYEDGVLTLLNQGNFRDCSFYAMVFTSDGLQFLADYRCNLDVAPNIHHYIPTNYDQPISLR